MMLAICWFELRRKLRSISTWVYFAVFAALSYLMMTASAGAYQGASVSFGAGGKVLANSPFALFNSTAALTYFGLLVISAIFGKAAFQDFEYNTHSFFFTSPISKSSYIGGRFLAAFLTVLIVFTGISLGLAAGTAVPMIDKARIGPAMPAAYIAPYVSVVIPNTLLMGALFFSMALLSRRILPVYMASVVLLIGYLIASSLTQKIEDKAIAALLDPFGMFAEQRVTEYWTITEKNTRLLWPQGLLLWNRVIWLGLATALFAFTLHKFGFVYAPESRRTRKPVDDAPPAETASLAVPGVSRSLTLGSYLRALLRLTIMGFRETVKNIYFAVIVLAGILFMILFARDTGSMFGTSTYPVTYQILTLTSGSFALFILIIITFYSGELIWRERDARTHEITDTLPVPDWLPYFAKLFALLLVQVLLMVVVMLTGMGIQLAKGYTKLEPALYIQDLFGLRLFDYALLCVLAIAVHVLVNNKYLGHFVMILYYVVNAFMGQFGYEHNLYQYGGNPGYEYSDMNGYGPFLMPLFWFNAYWAAFAIILALASQLFWVRGVADEWRWRQSIAAQRFRGPQRIWLAGAVIAFAALGGFIFYNTNIRNPYRTSKQRENLQVQYERQYKKYAKLPQPRITSVSLKVDLKPEERSARIRGAYALTNTNSVPVQQIFVSTTPERTVRSLDFHRAVELEWQDDEHNLRMYKLGEPLAPGASALLDFDLEFHPRGFTNGRLSTTIAGNGTFLNSGMFPHFGYDEGREMSDDNTRRKYGLPQRPRMPDLYDREARGNTYIAKDADWVDFEATIGTSPDQIAIAPGELVREWNDNGRRYFHYRTRQKVLAFFSVLSARYKLLQNKWNDVDLRIYYHPGHEYNLAKMMQGMKAALDYCTKNFGPYQHKTLRIVEFPRYGTFAQSFPASIPYSESIGFIARVKPDDEEDVDYPYYVTAHEVAHQWWAHQVIGANVQGATVMSESLSQYTALMVMKQAVGPGQMKRFLKYEMDRYLMGRSLERKKELPLMRVENQPYIHYNKASVIFYALQDYIGEDTVNRALREYLESVANQNPPYTTSVELVERLRNATPPRYAYLINDMFETITLFENRAVSATWREASQGKYEVKLKVAARKVKAGELGEEREVPLADWVDVGVLDAKGNPIYLDRRKLESSDQEFTMIVDQVPVKAGIDPLNKLIDRKPEDNVMNATRI